MLCGGDPLQGYAAPALHPAGGQRGGEAGRLMWASPGTLPWGYQWGHLPWPQGFGTGLSASGGRGLHCHLTDVARKPWWALAPRLPPISEFQHNLLPQPPRSKYIHPDDELIDLLFLLAFGISVPCWCSPYLILNYSPPLPRVYICGMFLVISGQEGPVLESAELRKGLVPRPRYPITT